jgi:6-phospho-beta-glucosidase
MARRRAEDVDAVRVAVIGGGGFRTPMLDVALHRSAADLGLDEVVLYDVDRRRLDRIALVLDGIDEERAGGLPRRTTTDLDDAVDDVDAVLIAIRVGGDRGRIVDERVPLAEGVLGQETVGPGGIAFALRTIPVVRAIARRIAARAPHAWVVNLTNPAGLVTRAIRPIVGDRAIGICDSPTALCRHVAAALGRSPSTLRFEYLGVTHLGWLLGVHPGDEPSRDLLPGLLASEAAASVPEVSRLGVGAARSLGVVPNEYLVYHEHAGDVTARLAVAGLTRGESIERDQRGFWDERDPTPARALAAWRAARDARHATYMADATAAPPEVSPADDARRGVDMPDPWSEDELGYAAIAARFLVACSGGPPAHLIVETPVAGRIAGLDDDAIVEGSCHVGANRARPDPVRPLPTSLADTLRRHDRVDRLTLAAAELGSASLALDAIAAHPLVPSEAVAGRILAGYLEGHPTLAESLA